ncbi:short chain dehydrogenase [Mucilaginibacter sp. SG564]|uniref:short chain dehydrogenase n=1 Tax=unclassified Mucilaginibacter TaxID=2617802 RepID=UPI001555A6EB|nr:short chain dehydrogenase [Mucilaginibacter sp. SG564]NOW94569.1 NAD(P)-dependent dehydrogenase (short-subunit alcohol dehydrogenase family) [Mucilaginibacter sp. SG564]
MRVLFVGAQGTVGKRIMEQISPGHEIITAGRNSGDIRVDITSGQAIEAMFKKVSSVDALICTAASGAMDDFDTLTADALYDNMRGKFFGQAQLVLTGQHYLNDNGSFTLTSGIFADEPAKGVTGGGVVSGALHSFVLSAALELKRGLRVNVVSPGMVEDSAKDYGHLFPGLRAIPMTEITDAYLQCLNTNITGKILRVY